MSDPLTPPQEALLRAAAQPGGAILAGLTIRSSRRLLRLGYAVKRSLPYNVTAIDATQRGRDYLARLGT